MLTQTYMANNEQYSAFVSQFYTSSYNVEVAYRLAGSLHWHTMESSLSAIIPPLWGWVARVAASTVEGGLALSAQSKNLQVSELPHL